MFTLLYFLPSISPPYRTKPVSRSATAPFDRLRVFLITRSTDIHPLSTDTFLHPERSVRAIGRAVLKIHAESGVIGFWIGNGLNITKIFPVRSDMFCVVVLCQGGLMTSLTFRNRRSSSCPTSRQ